MTVKFQAFHSIKAINNREVLFNWSRTNPLGALDQVWRPKNRDELQVLLREHPGRGETLLEVREAVIEAASLRLRPIIMTSISAAFGSIPLMVWAGPGSGSRNTIGVVIFTGSIFATLLTLFVVPVFYDLLARFTKSPDWMARQIEAYEEAEATPAE